MNTATTNTPAPVPPSALDEVKEHILSDHREIRAMLDEVAAIVASVPPGEDGSAALRRLSEPVWKLTLFFEEHMAFEERHLLPLLLETGDWGTIRAKRLKEEHHAQRSVLRTMVKEFDARAKSNDKLFDDARWLVESFRKDMTAEENELETIRDDGFVAGQCTG
jgi:hypothetical protein